MKTAKKTAKKANAKFSPIRKYTLSQFAEDEAKRMAKAVVVAGSDEEVRRLAERFVTRVLHARRAPLYAPKGERNDIPALTAFSRLAYPDDKLENLGYRLRTTLVLGSAMRRGRVTDTTRKAIDVAMREPTPEHLAALRAEIAKVAA